MVKQMMVRGMGGSEDAVERRNNMENKEENIRVLCELEKLRFVSDCMLQFDYRLIIHNHSLTTNKD